MRELADHFGCEVELYDASHLRVLSIPVTASEEVVRSMQTFFEKRKRELLETSWACRGLLEEASRRLQKRGSACTHALSRSEARLPCSRAIATVGAAYFWCAI